LEFRQRAVSLFGEKVGIVDGMLRFTYQEYSERVNRLANALQKLGIKKGEVVSFITYNSHQLLEAYFAVPQISAVLNPINFRLFPSEIEYILNHAETKILCFHRDFLPLVQGFRDNLEQIEHFIILESDDSVEWAHHYKELLRNSSPEAEINLDDIDENAVVELFYTSGTTGQQKGVAITNRSLYIHTLTAIPGFQVSDRDTLLHIVPLFHVNGWGTPQFLTAVGGRHVIVRKIDYEEILRLIEVEKVTKILGVPTIFNGLLQHPNLDKYDLSSLEECVLGGAPSPMSLIQEIEDNIGCRAYVGYGLTETSPFIVIARPKENIGKGLTERQSYQAKTGLPLVGVRIRVVDDHGTDVPRDEKTIGEIIVRGNQVMDGYLKDQEATDEVVVNGWFHTGDMAVIDNEGYITIVDRKKDSSVEVEKIIQDHPAVFEVVVIGVPDEKWGEVPKALVIQKAGEDITEEDIIIYVKTRLAGYKAPKTVEFRSEFPKGGTGKILKRDLRNPYWEGYSKRIN